jgi:hypothetical protein
VSILVRILDVGGAAVAIGAVEITTFSGYGTRGMDQTRSDPLSGRLLVSAIGLAGAGYQLIWWPRLNLSWPSQSQ